MGELARVARGELVGPPDVLIRGVAQIERARAGDITFAVDGHRLRILTRSEASAAVVSREVGSLDRPFIRVDDPALGFARILTLFAPRVPRPEPSVSRVAWVAPSAELGAEVVVGPCAVVDVGAVVGDRTWIGAGCHVGRDAVIGADTVLHPGARVLDRCRIGRRVVLHSGAVVGADGFGFVTERGQHHKIPQIGTVEVEDDVEIGANTTIDRATVGVTRIGAGTKIDNLVQVGHNCEVGPGVLIAAQAGLSGSTWVGARCRFAGQTGTVGHLSIAPGTSVAARGVVTKDLEGGGIVSGFPARAHAVEMRFLAALRRVPELLDRLARIEAALARRAGEAERE